MGTTTSRELFQQIEQSCVYSDCPSQSEILEKNRTALIDQVMEHFDTDKSGTLTDFEVSYLIEALTNYIVNKFGHTKLRKDHVAVWVIDHLDINRDGRITREELRSQLGLMLEAIGHVWNKKSNINFGRDQLISKRYPASKKNDQILLFSC